MEYYHGPGRRGAYFEGWYLKHQGPEGELALIPAIHQRRGGERSATIQVITADQTRIFSFPERAFQAWEDQFKVRVSGNWFSQDGVYVDLEEGDFSLKGELRYGPFTRLESDIMGPFRRVPAMECVHTVLSMAHPLEGLLCLNGRYLDFSHGTGYIEGDRGRSFPRTYLWTQCCWQERQKGSIMLSIAHIPILVGGFTGCICQIWFGGRSYRMATYQGVKVVQWGKEGARLRQGDLELSVDLVRESGQPLRAPVSGQMERTIHESLCATVRYRLWERGKLMFDRTDELASYEYADEGKKRRGRGRYS